MNTNIFTPLEVYLAKYAVGVAKFDETKNAIVSAPLSPNRIVDLGRDLKVYFPLLDWDEAYFLASWFVTHPKRTPEFMAGALAMLREFKDLNFCDAFFEIYSALFKIDII